MHIGVRPPLSFSTLDAALSECKRQSHNDEQRGAASSVRGAGAGSQIGNRLLVTAPAISHCHCSRTLPTILNLHQRLHFAMSTKMMTFSVSSACACSFEFSLLVACCFEQTQSPPPTSCHPTHLPSRWHTVSRASVFYMAQMAALAASTIRWLHAIVATHGHIVLLTRQLGPGVNQHQLLPLVYEWGQTLWMHR